MLCRGHVARVRDREADFTDRGAALAAIGTGDVAYARDFKAERALGFPVLVDPDLVTYRAVGAQRGTLRDLVSLGNARSGLRALRRRQLQGRIGPHPLIFGATHVIEPDGTVAFAWVNDDFGDDAPVAEVLAALDR